MSNHNHKRKKGRPMQSHRVWIQPEMNEELDARKLSRAFLALALYQSAAEAEAQAEHEATQAEENRDECA